MTLANRLRDAPPKIFSGYDAVMSENCDNKLVYDTVVAPLVQSTLQGFNATVFCYGQVKKSSARKWPIFQKKSVVTRTLLMLFVLIDWHWKDAHHGGRPGRRRRLVC